MNTIQKRLTIVLALVCCLLWAAGGSALYWLVRARLVAEFDRTLKARAEALAALTRGKKNKAFKFESVEARRPVFGAARWPNCFQIWLPDGQTLDRSESLGTNSLPCRAGTRETPEFWNMPLPDGLAGRAIGIRFAPPKKTITPDSVSPPDASEEITLVMARHRAPLNRQLHMLKTAFLLVGAMMTLATIAVVRVVVRRQLGSLSSLAVQAATINASSLETRFPTTGMPGELLPICERLNDLLSRLEASFTRERRFTADVAHELRTPIAELRSLAEVALKYPGDVPTTTRAFQDALGVALEMESTTVGLLALARCEAGLQPSRLQPVVLRALLTPVLRSRATEARMKRLALSLDVPEDACWLSDPTCLRPIFTNLLSNAIEYAPDGGKVRLQLEEAEGRGRLRLSNTADNISPEDLPHLFERFWRKNSASSSSVHSGLGLAITKALADSLGLELRAELSAPNELTVVLSGARLSSPPAPSTEDPLPSSSMAQIKPS